MANKIALELIADTSGLLKGLDQAQKQVDKFMHASSVAGQALGSGVNQALDAFASLAAGGATAAGVMAGALVAGALAASSMTLAVAKQVEATDHLSQKTGLAVQTIQAWSVIMAENGFQAESLTTGMRKLSQQIIEARNPASAAANTFEQLGINITALGSTESTIRALADRFKALPDGPEKAALAVQLFGKSGLEMIPILNRGSQAFDESRAAAERFGLVLSREQVTALNAADDAADQLGQSLNGLKNAFALAFADATTSSIKAITQAVVSLRATIASLTGSFGTGGGPVNDQEILGTQIRDDTIEAVKEYEAAAGEAQERIGTFARNMFLADLRNLEVKGHAEEALGKTVLSIIQREQAERNQAFSLQLQQADELANLQFAKVPEGSAKAFDDQLRAAQHLMDLMPELTLQEANLLALHNQDQGARAVEESTQAYLHRNDALDMAVEGTQAVDRAQQALFQSEAGLFGASDAARRTRFALIDAEAARKRQAIDEEIFDETRKAEAIQNLEIDTDTKRRQAIQAYPSFFEQQMQAIVNSNAFSMGSMVSNWSSGIAQMVVHGGNLQAVWEQTQVALVQAALNSGVQMLAQAALWAAQEIGIVTAKEAATTAATAAGAAARTAITQAEATAEVGIMTGAQGTIMGLFGAVAGALKALFIETLVPAIIAVGKFVIGVLSSIAAAMKATIFGIPVGIAILAGIAAIVAALAATGNLGFKEGGIGDFGSGTQATLHGREAVIPLNERGAGFMRDMLGLGGVEHTTNIYLDGELIARKVDQRIRRRAALEGALL